MNFNDEGRKVTRTPPLDVTRQLRSEVGFGCPVPKCGNPYLEWHHFDPPYHEEEHHRAEGMIALCAEHHKKADAGAYTRDQLRAFKGNRANSDLVRGSFDWFRHDLLAIVGGNFFYQTPRILVVDGKDVVWTSRDEAGYIRINVEVLSLSPEPRALVRENFWHQVGFPVELLSPPNGRILDVRYASGDRIRVEFLEIDSIESALGRYKNHLLTELQFPLTAVEVNLWIGGADISVSSRSARASDCMEVGGGLSTHSKIGFDFRIGMPWRQNTKTNVLPKYPRNVPCPCQSGKRYKDCHGLIT
jgi:hypothetical protein